MNAADLRTETPTFKFKDVFRQIKERHAEGFDFLSFEYCDWSAAKEAALKEKLLEKGFKILNVYQTPFYRMTERGTAPIWRMNIGWGEEPGKGFIPAVIRTQGGELILESGDRQVELYDKDGNRLRLASLGLE